QKHVPAADRVLLDQMGVIHNVGEELKDFADTAALMQCVDLVISVDTAIAHLAGAVGKLAWVLLPYIPAWRWLMGREDSPWYANVRLFRQPSFGDWDSVLMQVQDELLKLFS